MRTYELASPADDETIRALLGENAMPSWAAMSMEREPSYFAGSNRFGRDWAVVARDGEIPIGMYACSEQNVHLNGVPVELGYLGALRVSPGYRHRFRILREGYASIREHGRSIGPALWYTAISQGNAPARRMLEANLPGMPRYRYVNDLVTLALPRARGRRLSLWRKMGQDEAGELCAFYNRYASRYQFSPALTPEIVRKTGAPFFVALREGDLIACMALWNQQEYKQIVARGYRRPLSALVPIYNAYAQITRRVPLPRVGHALDQTSLAFLAVASPHEDGVVELLRDALALCPSTVMTLGLHAGHAWHGSLSRAFGPLTYATRLYTVSFEGMIELDGRPAQPEVAVL